MVDSHGLYCSESRTAHYRNFASPDSCSLSDMKQVMKLIPVEKKFRLVKKKRTRKMAELCRKVWKKCSV